MPHAILPVQTLQPLPIGVHGFFPDHRPSIFQLSNAAVPTVDYGMGPFDSRLLLVTRHNQSIFNYKQL